MDARIQRTLFLPILEDLDKKIVLLSGPRQVGKTHLSKVLFPHNSEYLSFDSVPHRQIFRQQSWSRKLDLVVFDEVHKMKDWKR